MRTLFVFALGAVFAFAFLAHCSVSPAKADGATVLTAPCNQMATSGTKSIPFALVSSPALKTSNYPVISAWLCNCQGTQCDAATTEGTLPLLGGSVVSIDAGVSPLPCIQAQTTFVSDGEIAVACLPEVDTGAAGETFTAFVRVL